MNKKIINSLIVLSLATALAIGSTFAYFNDTEISRNNIFTAGSIDLKVDHAFSSYNGGECVQECVENFGENLIKNGSFENPEVTSGAKWQIFPSGASGLEWTVEWAGNQAVFNGRNRPEPALIEFHEGVLGNAQDGDQYTELDSDWFGASDPLSGEPALVRIYQDVATVPGARYNLHYYYAPRSNIAAAENIMTVSVDGVQVAAHNPPASGSSIVWSEYTYEFTAAGASTRIGFAGGGPDNSTGVFLDDVKLCPYTCTYEVAGGNCSLWGEKDLEPGDTFWNFDDVKPGDWGINIISLHAYDNDAYVCLIAHDIEDQENGLADPETKAGDISAEEGELSRFLETFAWEDVNGNNAYDDGDIIISGPGIPFNIALGKIALAASQTKYIGVAWCLGEQTLDGFAIVCNGNPVPDSAQTDIMNASFTAYAAQQRNNNDFACTDVILPARGQEQAEP